MAFRVPLQRVTCALPGKHTPSAVGLGSGPAVGDARTGLVGIGDGDTVPVVTGLVDGATGGVVAGMGLIDGATTGGVVACMGLIDGATGGVVAGMGLVDGPAGGVVAGIELTGEDDGVLTSSAVSSVIWSKKNTLCFLSSVLLEGCGPNAQMMFTGPGLTETSPLTVRGRTNRAHSCPFSMNTPSVLGSRFCRFVGWTPEGLLESRE